MSMIEAKRIGMLPDGRTLSYDGRRYRFYLADEPVGLKKVRCMDQHGAIAWNYLEQRDWMLRLDEEAFEECAARALIELGDPDNPMSEQDKAIAEHIRKDNSYIHGKIVDADAQAAERLQEFKEERTRIEQEEGRKRQEIEEKEAYEAPIREQRERQIAEAAALSGSKHPSNRIASLFGRAFNKKAKFE